MFPINARMIAFGALNKSTNYAYVKLALQKKILLIKLVCHLNNKLG